MCPLSLYCSSTAACIYVTYLFIYAFWWAEIITGTGHIKAVNTLLYLGSTLKSSSTTISELETRIRDGTSVNVMLNFVL